MKNRICFVGFMMLSLWSFSAHAQRFTRSTATPGQPVVTDTATGLIWQGCARGQSGDTCGTGSSTTSTWQAALAYCEGLTFGGHSDWRLPNVTELESIVDFGRHSPAIDVTAFPATPSNWFWSSSSYAYFTSYAWYVIFDYGRSLNVVKTSNYHARCVRSGP